MIDKARDIALQTLYKIDIEGAYSNIILDEMIRKNRNNLGEKDIGLISEIVYGVTTWKLTLDEIVKKYSKIKIKKDRETHFLRFSVSLISNGNRKSAWISFRCAADRRLPPLSE